MKSKFLAASAIAIVSVCAGTLGSAATVTPDTLFIESNNNRGDGLGTIGDIVGTYGLGDITGLNAGIAGRIVNANDTFSFVSNTAFNISFVDLADLLGVDIDDCAGFDGSDCSDGSADNEPGRTARFSLHNGAVTTHSADFTSTIAAGTSIFSNVSAGTYTFSIDGRSGPAGSAYDIAISAVPVPAGLPLLLSALGLAGFFARRTRS